MDMRVILAALLCLCLPAIEAHAVPVPSEQLDSAICWRGESGFVFGLPEGWQNDLQAAEQFNVCLMGVLNGTDFDNSPVILYPIAFDRSPDQSPKEVADSVAQASLEIMLRAPGGEKVSVRAGDSFTTPENLSVEVRYFDDGPHPNVFEAVAYVMHHTAALGLILSAKTIDARDQSLPALLQVARECVPMRVIDEQKPTEK